jgi:hypothetical protein
MFEIPKGRFAMCFQIRITIKIGNYTPFHKADERHPLGE